MNLYEALSRNLHFAFSFNILADAYFYTKMKKVVITLFVLLFTSCSEKESPTLMNVDIKVDIHFLNEQNEDLLSTNTPDHYNYDNIKLYYLVEGEVVLTSDYDPQLGNAMMLITETNPYYLRCFTYANENDGIISDSNGVVTGISYTYLKLNNEDTDTIKTEWQSVNGKSFVNTKVWYNGEFHLLDGKPFRVTK